jgi:HEPN domain-containing protein
VLGHAIERLCRQAARWDPRFDERVSRWSILDGFYVPTRYPNTLPDSIPARVYTQDAAHDAVELEGEIVALVREWFSRPDAGP